MFYYYGRKKRIIKYYPKPEYDIIIEPFAGSAAYSMEYFDKNVILCELNYKIYSVWKFLIEASSSDILNLPIIERGKSLNDKEFDYLSDPEKWLIGLFLNPGSSSPKKSPGNFCKWNDKVKYDISENLFKIKHWKIINDSYEKLDNIKSTWFIDPPYQKGGKYYQHHNIDYQFLSKWCKERIGQIIVCENGDANWLPFEKLTNLRGQKHNTHEVIYHEKII